VTTTMDVPIRVTAAVPAFDEGDRLPAFLADWADEGIRSSDALVATLIVVDDGSDPGHQARHRAGVESAAAALRSVGAPHRVEYLPLPANRGKGAAIRAGWAQAGRGEDWLGFIDADGAVPAREFWRVARLLGPGSADAVCGSRVKMAGRSVERSIFRHLQGRVFAAWVEHVFRFGFYDTQCGFKFFRADRLRSIAPRLQEDRWLLDVETLDLLRRNGATFEEVPIDCHQQPASSLVFGLDPVRIAIRLLALRQRLHEVTEARDDA
jgi:dolichyl-phosphate beta-glucosyltransferase